MRRGKKKSRYPAGGADQVRDVGEFLFFLFIWTFFVLIFFRFERALRIPDAYDDNIAHNEQILSTGQTTKIWCEKRENGILSFVHLCVFSSVCVFG